MENEKDYTIWLNIFWGLKEQDLSQCHFSDYKCEGYTVYDDSFNPNSPQAQLSLLVSSSLSVRLPSIIIIMISNLTHN
jgi:hypothetical protein